MRFRVAIRVAMGVAITSCCMAHAGGLQITAQGLASGGGTATSPGGCRRLEGTFGEPVVGRSSGGVFVLSGGYQAGPGAGRRDVIFHHGFQECL
ncbi:hypothetical protein ACQQ2N_01250 [Dokdonella sp. MW10]|uniref:hypothetical protein n=1 Tax=Dokdonella sp. MW10 TaxID=2992926 RepID=UPI003F7DB169